MLFNVIFPEWLVSAMLVVLLTYTAHKTLSKGRSEWRKETEAKSRERMTASAAADAASTRSLPSRRRQERPLVYYG